MILNRVALVAIGCFLRQYGTYPLYRFVHELAIRRQIGLQAIDPL
jgi:hypothetical protein